MQDSTDSDEKLSECNGQCPSRPAQLSHQQWLSQVFREHELRLMGYATHLLGDRDRASDVVQDTFVRLCRQPREEVEQQVRPWLFRVCRNRALDVLKKEGRMKTMSDPQVTAPTTSTTGRESDPQTIVQQRERVDEADSLLSNLPHKQREVIRLKVQGDLSYREISELTGLSVSNVGYLLHTGLKSIRSHLAATD